MKKCTYLLLLLLCPFSLSFGQEQSLATPPLSPLSEISQQVGLATITLSYSRPSARGRVIFGDLVPFDEIWRTGANASTQLSFSQAVMIGEDTLPAGKYALYSIPGKEEWTMIFHNNTRLRSLAGRYNKKNDALRFTVKPEQNSEKVETFTIEFSDIHTEGLTINLRWENTIVRFPIKVEVDAMIEAQMAELMETPDQITPSVYFRAAEYYLHNEKNLDQAEDWIEEALAGSPKNFRYGLLHAKILYAQGKKKAAMETIKAAHQWAVDAENANYIGQTELFMKQIGG